jgi:hypothetical protein
MGNQLVQCNWSNVGLRALQIPRAGGTTECLAASVEFSKKGKVMGTSAREGSQRRAKTEAHCKQTTAVRRVSSHHVAETLAASREHGRLTQLFCCGSMSGFGGGCGQGRESVASKSR